MRGTLREVGGRFVLRFERTYPHSCEQVWRALTDPAQLAEWFPAAIIGERRAGASLRFEFGGAEGPTLEGELRVFEPPHRLEYSWGGDVLRWELSPTQGGCSLVFTTTVEQRSTAPRDAAGWDACLERLAAVVSGRPAPSGTSHAERYSEYVLAFGVGAFPEFLLGAERAATPLLSAPGLRGQTYGAPDGARLAVLHATLEAEVEPHELGTDAYLVVLEGSVVLRLGQQELRLPAGTEFHVPGGGRVSGRLAAGTRLIYASGPQLAR